MQHIRASSEPQTQIPRDAILAYFLMKPPMPCLPGCWWGDFSLPISLKRSQRKLLYYFLPVTLLVTVNVALAVFPAASAALTVRRLGPFLRSIDETLHDDVPNVAAPCPPRSFVHVTLTTPTLSETVPASEMVDALIA
jgi:hypothetical protein